MSSVQGAGLERSIRERDRLAKSLAGTEEGALAASEALRQRAEMTDAKTEMQLRETVSQLAGDPTRQAAARARLAALHASRSQHTQAREVYEAIGRESPLTPEGIDAPFRVGLMQELQGKRTEALEQYRRALESYPIRLRSYLEMSVESTGEDPNGGYFANRARLEERDRTIDTLRKIISLAESPGKAEIERHAKERLASLAAPGDRSAHGCLAALKLPPFVPPTAHPALSENSTQLALLKWAHQPEALEHTFRALKYCISHRGPPLQHDFRVPLLTRLWLQASRFASKGHFDESRRVLSEAILTLLEGTEQAVAHYGIGLSYEQEALYPEAISEFRLAAQAPALSPTARYHIGLAQFHQGLYSQAIQSFGRVLKSLARAGEAAEDPQAPRSSIANLQSSILNRLAQSHEFLGDFPRARPLYQQIAESPGAHPDLRALCQTALSRLERTTPHAPDHSHTPALLHSSPSKLHLSTTPSLRPPPSLPCRYIGENRADRGNWFWNHGSEVAILCAMLSSQDILYVRGREPVPHHVLSGGTRGRTLPSPESRALPSPAMVLPLNYRFTTGRDGERGRRWLSKLHDPGGPDLALWNPITFGHSIGVFDDFGEQLPPRPGDLVLSLSMPAGPWRLSLCLINDHNYYESNRRYTIHVRDRNNRFLTGCEVEGFLTPSYKHFAVTGPIGLTVHIQRDSSLNTLLSGIFLDPLPPDGVAPALRDGGRSGRGAPAPRKTSPDHGPSNDLWRPFLVERRLGRSAALQKEALSRGCDLYAAIEAPDRPLEEGLLRLSLSLHAAGDFGGTLIVDQELLTRSFGRSPAAARHHVESQICLYDDASRRDLGLKLFEAYLALIQSRALHTPVDDPHALILADGEDSSSRQPINPGIAEAPRRDRRMAILAVSSLPGPRPPADGHRPQASEVGLEAQPTSGSQLPGQPRSATMPRGHGEAPSSTPFHPRSEILSAAMTQFHAHRWRFVEAALERLKQLPDTQRRTAIPVLSLPKGPGRLSSLEAPEDGPECPSYLAATLPPGILAQAYRGLGRYGQAGDLLEEAIEQRESERLDDLPDPELEEALAQDHFDLVCSRVASMDLSKAEQALERAEPHLQDDDRAANARYLLGLETLRSHENPSRSAYHFQQVIARFPNSHWAEKAKFYLQRPRDPRFKTQDQRLGTEDRGTEPKDRRPGHSIEHPASSVQYPCELRSP